MKSLAQLKKNLKKDFSNFKSIKIAILGDTATQFLAQAVRGAGYEEKLDLEIWEAEFNQIERQVFDKTSELYAFKPDITIVFLASHKLLGKYNKLKIQEQNLLSSTEFDAVQNITKAIGDSLKSKVVLFNYTEIDDSVYGSFSNSISSSFLFQLRKLNYQIMEYASVNKNVFICDISSIQNLVGKNTFFRPSVYVNTEMVLNVEVLPTVAFKTVDIIKTLNGQFNKCVILDLDNTTWGGIIGDDGIENIEIGSLGIGKAFSEFQYWVKKLKNRGVIVAVCSKNTESVAKEPFEKHPDMVLRMEDIAVFVANWENKADNIRHIQSILNIGFDSMVFLDDNPVERSIVRENLPEVSVPELPQDPAEYLEYLYSLNLFETVSSSKEDSDRTKLYQVEAKRAESKQKVTNEADFLKSLEMKSLIEEFNKFNTPRVAQLSQRSNQFNLRTIRYAEEDIKRICASEKHHTFAFSLVDKFGDNGLICVVILEEKEDSTMFVDTWFMSCRVLKRGMEDFVTNTLVSFAKDKGIETLKGEYIPTAKNAMVKNHYASLGFVEKDNYWLVNVNDYVGKSTFIETK